MYYTVLLMPLLSGTPINKLRRRSRLIMARVVELSYILKSRNIAHHLKPKYLKMPPTDYDLRCGKLVTEGDTLSELAIT